MFRYPTFNAMQSKVLPDLLRTDRSLVISAPTGAGKTVALELALIRMLQTPNHGKRIGSILPTSIYICRPTMYPLKYRKRHANPSQRALPTVPPAKSL